MTINNFISGYGNITSSAINSLTSDVVLKYGATLNVAGSQLPVVYTSAVGFDVTVNYNYFFKNALKAI